MIRNGPLSTLGCERALILLYCDTDSLTDFTHTHTHTYRVSRKHKLNLISNAKYNKDVTSRKNYSRRNGLIITIVRKDDFVLIQHNSDILVVLRLDWSLVKLNM